MVAPWPVYGKDVADTVARVITSGRLNYWGGEHGVKLEQEFSAWLGVQNSIAVSNGTMALECCLRAIGIGHGDEVIVTPRSFIASVSPVVLLGAKPIFADIDRNTQNITANTIQQVLSTRTKAILLVHFAGVPCDMEPILVLAKKHNLRVIEDCAQALGAKIGNRRVGTFGDMATFSFCQDKILSTGEGGMVSTSNKKLWEKAWSYKDHGKSWHSVFKKKHPPGYRWYHESFGTNGRMTEIQSSMARLLLPKVDGWIRERDQNAQIFEEDFGKIPSIRVLPRTPGFHSAFYKFHCFVNREYLQKDWTRTRIQETLFEQGIPCLVGSCSEIYREKAFPRELRPLRRLPMAKELGETSLMFPIHPGISKKALHHMTSAVETVMASASRSSAGRVQRWQPSIKPGTLSRCEF